MFHWWTNNEIAAIGNIVAHSQAQGGLCTNPCYTWSTHWSSIETNLRLPGGGLIPY